MTKEKGMLEITIYPNPVLRIKTEPVERIDDSILKLLDEMAEVMYQKDGVGLAAPQVGVSKRILVADIGDGLLHMINPEIIRKDGEEKTVEEGCLSFPGIRLDISRPESVVVSSLNEKGERVEIKAEGMWARVFQHEIDHLDGVLFIDRINSLQRVLLRPKLKKLEKTSAGGGSIA
jgi:peptide deformylase